MGIFESSRDGIRLPARGRNRFGNTSIQATVRLDRHDDDYVVCVVQLAPNEGSLVATLSPDELFALAASGQSLEKGQPGDESWFSLPPQCCRKAAAWLREQGLTPPAKSLGPRSRPSGLSNISNLSNISRRLAERLGPRAALS